MVRERTRCRKQQLVSAQPSSPGCAASSVCHEEGSWNLPGMARSIPDPVRQEHWVLLGAVLVVCWSGL